MTIRLGIPVVLALISALFYFLLGAGVLTPGDLPAEEAPAAIPIIAGLGYAIGGLLILARKRWLWVVGAVINALAIAFFFAAHAGRPAVLFSTAGVATKVAQILLEVVLIALIVTTGRHTDEEATT